MFEITPERRELLEKYILRDGRTVVSSYAPAISDGKISPPNASKNSAASNSEQRA